MAKSFKIDDEVRDVLRGAMIDSSTVKITRQLDRKLYERVNKVLAGAGGKWNRKAGVHIFQNDPRQVLGLAIDTGVGVNVQQATQQFFTPPALANRVIELARLQTGNIILEPSAGNGNLINAIPAITLGVKVVAVEINQTLCAVLKDRFAGNGLSIYCADFLAWPDRHNEGTSPFMFDRVVMNPPFERGSDVKHIQHALTMVKPGGRLVSICAAGPSQVCAAENERWQWIPLPVGSFKESGTGVNTAIVVIDK